MILTTGSRSTIVQALAELMPEQHVVPLRKRTALVWDLEGAASDSRVVIATGYMAHKAESDLTQSEADLNRVLNFEEPMTLAGQVLRELPRARVCVIGSWSARVGSFDTAYATWKAQLHAWVERAAPRVAPPQQLVCVAPPIIADSAMTRARKDYPEVLERRPHCTAADVARTLRLVLFEQNPGSTDPVIFMPATAGPWPRTPPC